MGGNEACWLNSYVIVMSKVVEVAVGVVCMQIDALDTIFGW